jgi:mannose-1-phosphate guanylyltransferase/mannose-6-phosphate isomerase
LLLVLPTDHLIRDAQAFATAVAAALAHARDGALVTFGIPPKHAATGYGYIEQGEPLIGHGDARVAGVFRIARFVEKPDLARAEAFVAGGRHFWNAGIFLFLASRYLEELEAQRPDVLAAVRAAWDARYADLDFVRLAKQPFERAASVSIDYAVMEATRRGVVVRAEMGWSDVGAWAELHAVSPQDADGNAAHGDVLLANVAGSYVRAESRLVAALNVKGLAIVETADAVLVSDLAGAQQVKELVEAIEKQGRSEHLVHRRVHRPWGYYESIDSGAGYQVKRLMLKAGHAISLQRHAQRAEHWVVVSGRARVTRGEETIVLGPNQSTYIPLGAVHRLENAGAEPLFVIEVQSGSYLGEDDIERLDDPYRR